MSIRRVRFSRIARPPLHPPHALITVAIAEHENASPWTSARTLSSFFSCAHPRIDHGSIEVHALAPLDEWDRAARDKPLDRGLGPIEVLGKSTTGTHF